MNTLRGRRVLVTRERPGELARLLEASGAVVVHVPLIEVVEPDLGHHRGLGAVDRRDRAADAAAKARVGQGIERDFRRLADLDLANARLGDVPCLPPLFPPFA